MPATKTSNEASASALDGSELVRVVQSGGNAKATIDQIRTYFGKAGLPFPSVQIPNSDPNTLDDYEEGTFTPLMQFGGNSVGVTYSIQVGDYQKNGNRVLYDVCLGLSAKGSSTGTAGVGGLPFTVGQVTISAVGSIQFIDLNVASAFYMLTTFVSATSLTLVEAGDNNDDTVLTEADFANNSIVRFNGHYRV